MALEKQIIEIIKQRDEFPASIEITTINSKFHPQISVKIRGENPDAAAATAKEIFNALAKVYPPPAPEPKKEEPKKDAKT